MKIQDYSNIHLILRMIGIIQNKQDITKKNEQLKRFTRMIGEKYNPGTGNILD